MNLSYIYTAEYFACVYFFFFIQFHFYYARNRKLLLTSVFFLSHEFLKLFFSLHILLWTRERDEIGFSKCTIQHISRVFVVKFLQKTSVANTFPMQLFGVNRSLSVWNSCGFRCRYFFTVCSFSRERKVWLICEKLKGVEILELL